LVTHTLLMQVALAEQVPQLSEPPQPSGMLPQFLACAVQLVGVQPPPVWQVPPTQLWLTGQVQVIVPPQPSDTGPQAAPTPPEPHVFGVHAGWHVPLLVPLQTSPERQAQLSVPPQPLGTLPQLSPLFPAGQLLVVQPHWFGVPPPPQVSGAVQVPQFTVPPLPSEMVPQLALAAVQIAPGLPPPVEHMTGFAGGLGSWQAEWKCSSATQLGSQVAADPALVQQWRVEENPQTAATQPDTVVPLSQPDTSAAPVQVRSCVHEPGPGLVPMPHLLPLQVWPLGQVPHVSTPPQPSEIVPQVALCAAHVAGVQVVPGHAETGFCAGVGQSSKPKPAERVKVAANCAHPLSHVLEQQ
jgi:hypothetical protein